MTVIFQIFVFQSTIFVAALQKTIPSEMTIGNDIHLMVGTCAASSWADDTCLRLVAISLSFPLFALLAIVGVVVTFFFRV